MRMLIVVLIVFFGVRFTYAKNCNPRPPCLFKLAYGYFAKDEVIILDDLSRKEIERCSFVSKDSNTKTRTYQCSEGHKIQLHQTTHKETFENGYSAVSKINVTTYDNITTKTGTCHDGSGTTGVKETLARAQHYNYCTGKESSSKPQYKAAPARGSDNAESGD